MESKPATAYQYFLRCCHDYSNNTDRLSKISRTVKENGSEIIFAGSSEIDYVLQKTLKEQISFVDSSFDKLDKKDPILAKIMYQNLVEKKTFDEIGRQRLLQFRRARRVQPPGDAERQAAVFFLCRDSEIHHRFSFQKDNDSVLGTRSHSACTQ